jgi:hypothetical protein
MSTAMTKVRGTLLAASAAAALMFVASAAEAKCRSVVDDDGEISQFCSYGMTTILGADSLTTRIRAAFSSTSRTARRENTG